MNRSSILVLPLLLGLADADAGMLAHGHWSPDACGLQPAPPVLDTQSVEGFNKSVAKINAWQQQASAYYECLVKEANTDSGIIADSANAAQAQYRQQVEKIGAEAEAAKKKLDAK